MPKWTDAQAASTMVGGVITAFVGVFGWLVTHASVTQCDQGAAVFEPTQCSNVAVIHDLSALGIIVGVALFTLGVIKTP